MSSQPAEHARYFIETPDSLYDHLPLGPWRDEEHFQTQFWTPRIETMREGAALWAVFNKTCPAYEAFAGMIGYLNTSFTDLCTEIGFIIILPPFQRTHVTTNAMGLLMQYALNLPDDPSGKPGLGFRRLVWQASTGNHRSIATAERMGFQREGVLRWRRVLDDVNARAWNGKMVRKGDVQSSCLGRDTVLLSVCWDDWESGVQQKVDESMKRRS